MKKMFWKVQIETYKYGEVKANIVGSRLAVEKPQDGYCKDQWREVFVRWFDVEAEAHSAVALSKGAVA